MLPAPSPTHTSPGVQVILVLLHFPTAWVATLHQVIGSEVHAINLSLQSLHLLVQDVKPDMDEVRISEAAVGNLSPRAAQSPESVALAFSFHLLHIFDQLREGRRRKIR